MSHVCSIFRDKIFPDKNRIIDRQIEEEQQIVSELFHKLQEKEKERKEVIQSIKFLSSSSTKVDPDGVSKEFMLKGQKKKLGLLLKAIKKLKGEMRAHEAMVLECENLKIDINSVGNIKKQKARLEKFRSEMEDVDADEITEDLDDIADMQEELHETSEKIDTAMTNAWTSDMDTMEAMVDDYLETIQEENEEDTIYEQPTPKLPEAPKKSLASSYMSTFMGKKEEAPKAVEFEF